MTASPTPRRIPNREHAMLKWEGRHPNLRLRPRLASRTHAPRLKCASLSRYDAQSLASGAR